MTIQEDILTLEQKQKDYFALKSKYLQCLQTPDSIPVKQGSTDFTKLIKPEHETDEFTFEPKTKDYAFEMHEWTGAKTGCRIMARRDLGDGIIEEVYKVIGED